MRHQELLHLWHFSAIAIHGADRESDASPSLGIGLYFRTDLSRAAIVQETEKSN
jgi:hypothetical protein